MKPSFLASCVFALFFVGVCIAEAQELIEIGESYSLSQPPSSTSVYQIELSHPAEVTISITGWQSTHSWGRDIDRLYVFNEENKPIARNQFSSEEDPYLFHMFGATPNLTFRVGQAGVYTIRVHSGEEFRWENPGGQNYKLTVSAVDCPDVHEPNDDFESATPITIGSPLTAYQWRRVNTADVQGDEDWYKVTVTTPGRLRIELIDWIPTLNWSADFDRLFVYNEERESIGSRGGNAFYGWMMGGVESAPNVIEMNLAHAGSYYLRYHAGAGTSTTPYRLSTSFISAADPFEPNDDLSSAKQISESGTWYQAYEWRSLDNTMNVSGDEDYYYFVASGAGEYTLNLDGWIPILNWSADYDRMFLYDAQGNNVGENPIARFMGNDPIRFSVPSGGKYYIRLHCGGVSSVEGYRFQLVGDLADPEPVIGIQMYAGITIRGETGENYEIQYSETVESPNWTPLEVINLSESPYLYIDRTSPAHKKRFYRVVKAD